MKSFKAWSRSYTYNSTASDASKTRFPFGMLNVNVCSHSGSHVFSIVLETFCNPRKRISVNGSDVPPSSMASTFFARIKRTNNVFETSFSTSTASTFRKTALFADCRFLANANSRERRFTYRMVYLTDFFVMRLVALICCLRKYAAYFAFFPAPNGSLPAIVSIVRMSASAAPYALALSSFKSSKSPSNVESLLRSCAPFAGLYAMRFKSTSSSPSSFVFSPPSFVLVLFSVVASSSSSPPAKSSFSSFRGRLPRSNFHFFTNRSKHSVLSTNCN